MIKIEYDNIMLIIIEMSCGMNVIIPNIDNEMKESIARIMLICAPAREMSALSFGVKYFANITTAPVAAKTTLNKIEPNNINNIQFGKP